MSTDDLKRFENNKLYPNDEYYTMYEDAEKWLSYYKEYLRGKKIICPCDSMDSNIYKWLKDNKFNVERDSQDLFKVDYSKYDIIITNPPFSIFRKIIDFWFEQKIDFICIGSNLAGGYKNVNKYMQEKRLFVYDIKITKFYNPYGEIKRVKTYIYTTLRDYPKPPFLELKVDDGVRNHDSYKELRNTNEWQAVPLSFFTHYNSDQFEIGAEIRIPKKFKRILVKQLDILPQE